MAVAVYEETECRKNCPAQDTNLPPETSSALESGTSISSSREVLPAPPTAILENIHESGAINLNLAEGGKDSLFCIVMLGVASGTGGVFTSNDHQSLSCIACKSPGCAADVTKIWCGEDELLKGLPIPLCTSISQKSKTVCQHNGRTFVLMIEEGKKCDMEQYHDHVPSEKTECPPLLEAAQNSRLDTVRGDTTLSAPTLNADMTTSPPPENGSLFVGVIVILVIGFIGVVVAVYLIRQKQQGASRNQDEETEMSALNNGIKQNGGPANRDNNEEVAVNMLDNGGPLSHRQ
ncbi:uncharacterized protein LOC115140163 isoform X4 [Oncorhynchus nerka]|uniref:uncharacterized protein LOC115140163 isoform X4 n=1 Tax=Oncorhynchus nerka TaxID=8023 RepID=UPI001131C1F7|nr:uncharacterized protein LOC115140163 isoform X3 [Oncorhynchus nerka]